MRQFGDRTFRSVLRAGPKGMRERFGPLSFDLDLRAGPDCLEFPVKAGRVLGIPLPRVLLPVSDAVERETDGRFTFDVRLSLPLGLGLLVHYQGWLTEIGGE